jgi:HD superfamily phosphohydrolase
LLEAALDPYQLTPEAIVSLVLGRAPPDGSPFVHDGRDFAPLLRQFVAGELDADRLDYLRRDSLYTGVSYGHVDLDWLIENTMPIEVGTSVQLGLSTAAIFAFEDFLLSRFHMFVSVYFHHTSVNFDAMLERFLQEADGDFELPADPERFAQCDDVALFHALRASANRWARRIVLRQPYRLAIQATQMDKGYDIEAIGQAFEREGIDHFVRESIGLLSKQRGLSSIPMHVVDLHAGTTTPIADYTPLYQRYAGALHFKRIYCAPEHADRAARIVSQHLRGSTLPKA